MDQLRELRTAIAIEEEGSLAAAARKLNTSLPSVSRTLAGLESRLGLTLFDRSARRCQATEAGRSLLNRSRRLLAEYDDIVADTAKRWNEPRGLVTVTAPLTFGRLHVVPAISRFLLENPAIDVALELSDAVVDLQDDLFDVAVRIGPVRTTALVVRRVAAVSWWTLASPGYLASHGIPLRPDDLRNHIWIQHSNIRVPAGFRTAAGQRSRLIPLKPRLVVNDATAALEAAQTGLGICSAYSYQATEAVASGKLVRILRENEPRPMPVSIVYPEVKRTIARLRKLSSFLGPELSSRLRSGG
ncbi:LysR family transcriptional regulator [Chelativorans sp. YIM 93263]|uniref:LysR family transcriptional regulator n=1 Tax=Chelativorans sp. YIM 93263 TaxID=2906648 RepID=UPI002379EC49|nr:LysR family transcriptional regulator [Chelativorans sp. YIM 93263]